MKNIQEVIEEIIRVEGSAFTNDSKDSGGPTKYGVTQSTLSAYRGKPASSQDVEHMTRKEAEDIYLKKYYLAPKLDLIAQVSPMIAAEVMDTGVNTGPSVAVKFLQRLLNLLNREAKDYADLVVDGQCGASTASALKVFIDKRGREGELVVFHALNAMQCSFYLDLAERRPKDEAFVYGWLKNRVSDQIKN